MTQSPDTSHMPLRDVWGDAGPLSQGQNDVLKKYKKGQKTAHIPILFAADYQNYEKEKLSRGWDYSGEITPRAKQREIKRIKHWKTKPESTACSKISS